ncbi:hypothetical protein CCOS865_00469 [Pseudomonas reidholzensis]|uniref:RHS repeat-associated core domain-containing protein n=1 Tax=Pseudomonas reidholzensis TaxID=1785162 RepID=A0A383RMW7_9PSED|nr:RHS repeat-associated core domain-containing protein [Pseudomonas reidholzensis]SYX88245.1 hypothetical protein CCOS865_00469 [Pseudomonas reidholzensis]
MSATYLLGTDRQQSTLCGSGFAARAYSPYGAPSATAGPALGYAGHPPDPLTGHHHLGNGYRAYNPHLQRFNAPDRLSPFDKGGLNSYAYCVGDPINRRDPSGHEPEWLLPALAVATSLFGMFSSGLKIRSMYKVTKTYKARIEGFTPASAEASVPLPRKLDAALAGVSFVAGTAGLVLGVARIAKPGEEWQSWALFGLGLLSMGPMAIDAWRLRGAKPWERYPIIRGERHQTIPASARTSSNPPPGINLDPRASAKSIRSPG